MTLHRRGFFGALAGLFTGGAVVATTTLAAAPAGSSTVLRVDSERFSRITTTARELIESAMRMCGLLLLEEYASPAGFASALYNLRLLDGDRWRRRAPDECVTLLASEAHYLRFRLAYQAATEYRTDIWTPVVKLRAAE
jgi:hypothetical protein